MRIQTRGNSNVVWLSNDVGVIDGTMSLSAPTLERILQAVNEKYGTSFEGWSQKPTVYEVGDTVPNWNAYEKIMLPPQPILVKVQRDSSAWYACEVKQSSNGQYEVAVHGEEKTFYIFNTTGHNIGTVMQSDESRSLIMQVASEKTSQNVTTLSIIRGYVDNIENWDEYI